MRRTIVALAAGALATALVAGAPVRAEEPSRPWYKADVAMNCHDQPAGSAPFYHGPSASVQYDNRFDAGHVVPDGLLDRYVPQGLATWPDWGPDGQDLLVLSAYRDGEPAALVGLKPGSGQTRLVTMPENKSHAGGVAVVNGWLFVSGPTSAHGHPTVQRYPLGAVRTALATGNPLWRADGHFHEFTMGEDELKPSFLSSYGDTLYVGTFDSVHRNRMHRFTVKNDGTLDRVGGPDDWIQVPLKTQGLTVTGEHYIYSTSHGSDARSNIYVVRKGYKLLDNAKTAGDATCFRAPSMSEGITDSDGRIYLVYESGSYKYRTDECDRPQPFEGDCTLNIIDHLHWTTVSQLTSMT